MEDIYQKLETLSTRNKIPQPSSVNRPVTRELQSVPNIGSITTVTAISGSDSVDLTDLNEKLTNLGKELELVRLGVNAALNALRQISSY